MMELTCRQISGLDCDHVVSGRSTEHLVEEIVSHTAVRHPEQSAAFTAAEHRSALLRRVEDMLAGGPGTPV